MKKLVRRAVAGSLLGVLAGSAFAQRVTPVPRLDLNRFTGVWYQVARLPIKSEKTCTDQPTVLYALGDKQSSFQMGTFCQGRHDVTEEMDTTGKVDLKGDGMLKVSRLVIFSTRYDVLAVGPDYQWAVVGTPNHKVLSLLSRQQVISPETLVLLESKASAAGFDTGKVIVPAQSRNAVTVTTAPVASVKGPSIAGTGVPAATPASPSH